MDLYTLYTSVVRLGGMHRVAKKKLWKAVAAELRLPLTCTDYGFRLRRHYERYLCAPATVYPPTTPAAMFFVAVLLSAVCVLFRVVEIFERFLFDAGCRTSSSSAAPSPPR